MGLGGITRDSIADLASLVHDDDIASNTNKAVTHDNSREQFHQASFELSHRRSFNGESKEIQVEELNDAFMEVTMTEQACVLNDDGVAQPIDSTVSSNILPSAHVNNAAAPEMYYGFQYEGYQDYYAEDFSIYYSHDGAAVGEERKNIFCCLFAPWFSMKQKSLRDERSQQLQHDQQVSTSVQTTQGSQDNSDNNEQLSQQLKKAQTTSPSYAVKTARVTNHTQNVAAAVSPVAATSPTIIRLEEKAPDQSPNKNIPQTSLKTETNEELESLGLKSILKVKQCINRYNNTAPNPSNKKIAFSPDGKRHLFPSYETTKKNEDSEENRKKVGWIPMARVLTIPSRKDIPLSQKAQVWWQRSDYDDFKKTGRIISKAMECGGSEIWLTSTNAWGKGQQSRAGKESKKEAYNEQLVGKEAHVNNEYVKSLEKYTRRNSKSNSASTSEENSDDFGNKWWCKFGHSRRGLEHIVSSSEGKARQQSVILAIEMILEEQKRQRVTRTKDPNKLRNVALQYTSWARDLALAAGAADNEAVETNFDVSAKSRSHHFAERSKHLLSKNSSVAGGGVAMAISSQILDENTHGRRNSVKSPTSALKDVHLELDVSDTSLSKIAKGFIPGESSALPSSQIINGLESMQPRAALKA